jgi:hypothetical protein
MGIVFARLILDGVAGVKFILEGKPKHTLAILQAHFAFYGKFTKIQRTRMSYKGLPLLPFKKLKGTYAGSMVWQFYVRGHKHFSAFFK